ncbi:MAG: hypothetical protein H8E66_17585 [Planctomycetes bacterium]|nr:hypothetical protein [Planctomycetota bacterium]
MADRTGATTIGIVTSIAVLAAALVLLYVLFVRWHCKWLEQQTPVGSWTADHDSALIKLIFEGGPSEGIYKQLVETDDHAIREFGHWAVQFNTLNMLIMATDVHPHARFGIDTTYQIKYVGFDSIRIEGPDRPNLIFTRAEDMTSDFGLDEATDSANNS